MAEISLTGNQMLTVLEAVAREGPLSATEVARLCDMNRTVTYRLLTTLAQRAYVRKGDDGYTIGPAVQRLAPAADAGLRKIALPAMSRLARETGETVVLHAIDNLDAVVIEQAAGQRHLVRVAHEPGSRHALVQGASGWAILAFQPEATIARALRKARANAEARERVLAVRADGYAISHDELQQGVHGIAAPIVAGDGRCQASMAILVPGNRAASIRSFADRLIAAAREVCQAMA